MTKLYYKVGNEIINIYSQAVLKSKELNTPLITCYEPIPERIKVNAENQKKRLSAIQGGTVL